jgi:A/G-specific adenine glycosylase
MEDSNKFSPLFIPQFQKNCLDWYRKNARSLPWRESNNPYFVWISEIMLQQTRVATVIKYFSAFIKRFPTIHCLALSDTQDILCYWQGLGYYRRAINIHQAAKIINKDYQGSFPSNYKQIVNLPGIGPYTAGAIVSISFNHAIPAIDGNVKRVISRIFFLTEDINKPKTIKRIKEKIYQMIPENNPGEFNQALMEIGATLCSPKKPNCQQCPVNTYCNAATNMKQELLPIKKKRKPRKNILMEIAIVKNNSRFLLVKRPQNGVFANMWGLPAIESKSLFPNGNDICDSMQKELGLQFKTKPILVKKLSHIFTHQFWEISLYLFQTKDNIELAESYACWVKKEELHRYPIPQAFTKCLKEIF